jgi:hypothetical protein
VLLKLWDLCHLKAIDLNYSYKFESLHLHAQIKFYEFSKFTEQAKLSEHFLEKKYRVGQICPERAKTAQIQPRSTGDAQEMIFKWPAGGARLSAPLGGRIDTRRSRSSDQVTINGDRLSSPRQKRGRWRELGFGRGLTGAHLGRLGVDLAMAFGCGLSEKVDDVVGEAIVKVAWSWACSFTSRRSGEVSDGVGYRRSWPWKSIVLASPGV